MTPLRANPDVIVVGAGVAGLAAGAVLREAGLQVVVLEAAKHIGGRCVTDSAPFSVPFDKGASWLHAAPANPLARVAERTDARLHKNTGAGPGCGSRIRT
ncbi:NAD(P)-binding protein [Sulfitobacter aestuariivivens]|uniref:NAD(P)-binding protein n=1 Tax=Sulfitobacter aestuariivivens TaxID=2766981 RepID=UPI00361208D2